MYTEWKWFGSCHTMFFPNPDSRWVVSCNCHTTLIPSEDAEIFGQKKTTPFGVVG
jgi:hypothetical protein